MNIADDIQKDLKRQSDFYREREDESWNSCGPDDEFEPNFEIELTEEEQDAEDYEEDLRTGKIWCGADKIESYLA